MTSGSHRQGAGDDDLLLIAAGETADRRGERRRPDLEALHHLAHRLVERPVRHPAEGRGQPRQEEQPGVLAHRHRGEEAFALAVGGNVGDATADRLDRRGGPDRLALKEYLSRQVRVLTGQGAQHLARARSLQSDEAEHFAAMKVERHILERARRGEPAHAEQHIARGVLFLREEMGDLPADHHPHDLFRRRLGTRDGADIVTVAQRRDAVGNAEHLLQPVRDVDDGQSPAP